MSQPDQEILSKLEKIKEFTAVPKSQLEWLLSKSSLIKLKAGDFLFKPEDPIENTHFILSGELELYTFQNGNKRLFNTYTFGGIIGYLPYSRAVKAVGYGEALKPSSILSFPKNKIQKLISSCPELAEELVHIMLSRVRDFTSQQLQNEKMLALGKLSAGLTHELNNPISAINRDASTLTEIFGKEELNRLVLVCTGLSESDFSAFYAELETWKNPKNLPELKPLERSRLESKWEDMLIDMGVLDADILSETFAEFGINPEQLTKWTDKVQNSQKVLFINWIHFSLETRSLITNIRAASQRVDSLIGAVKSYTHMDRAPEEQEVDLYQSIRDTLTILAHKIKKNQIQVEFEKPDESIKIQGYIGELNQVWTNLIDNALDAMEDKKDGKLTIVMTAGKSDACISFTDTGIGIPEEELKKVFDPFFTTKAIGKGSGLGLDLVNQIINKHQGRISLESKLGKTEFKVTLPTH